MIFDPEDLFHDADGAAHLPPDSRTLHALNRLPGPLLFGRRAPSPDDPLTAVGLTRSGRLRRFRRRVVYPVTAILLGIPAFIVVFGSLGAMSRGTLEQELPEMLSIAGFFVLGVSVLAVLLTPVWRREYRVRVSEPEPEDLTVNADAVGLRMVRGGQVTVAATWAELSLTAVHVQEISSGRFGVVWDLVTLTIRDASGRQESMAVYRMDRGHAMAHRILSCLVDHDRLRKA